MTPSRSVDSWLLTPNPPLAPGDNGLGWSEGEARLWWAVVWQAAADVLELDETPALDAADFLRSTGAHLNEALWGISVEETRKELVRLMKSNPALRYVIRGVQYS